MGWVVGIGVVVGLLAGAFIGIGAYLLWLSDKLWP